MKLDQSTLDLSLVLERLFKVPLKDCFATDDAIYCIVAPHLVGKAVGKGGVNIKQAQEKTGKRVRVIGFQESVEEFIRQFIQPLTVEEIIVDEERVVIKDSQRKTKSLLIGRDGRNLQVINRAVKRFFPVNEVVVE